VASWHYSNQPLRYVLADLSTVLKSEIELAIRLLGANKISDLRPSMVEVKEK
jgi:hypothetical protein